MLFTRNLNHLKKYLDYCWLVNEHISALTWENRQRVTIRIRSHRCLSTSCWIKNRWHRTNARVRHFCVLYSFTNRCSTSGESENKEVFLPRCKKKNASLRLNSHRSGQILRRWNEMSSRVSRVTSSRISKNQTSVFMRRCTRVKRHQ